MLGKYQRIIVKIVNVIISSEMVVICGDGVMVVCDAFSTA